MNEELFRLYALWTFFLSSVYTIIYFGIYLGQYRAAFFIFLAVIVATVLLYWFRDGGEKLGWQSLDESLLVTFFLSVITCILMIIASVLAFRTFEYKPDTFTEFSTALSFIFKISPILLTFINLVNLLIFIARN